MKDRKITYELMNVWPSGSIFRYLLEYSGCCQYLSLILISSNLTTFLADLGRTLLKKYLNTKYCLRYAFEVPNTKYLSSKYLFSKKWRIYNWEKKKNLETLGNYCSVQNFKIFFLVTIPWKLSEYVFFKIFCILTKQLNSR